MSETILIQKMEAYETKMAFSEELNKLKILNVKGFPNLFIANDLQYYQVAKGYASFDDIFAVVNSVLIAILGSSER